MVKRTLVVVSVGLALLVAVAAPLIAQDNRQASAAQQRASQRQANHPHQSAGPHAANDASPGHVPELVGGQARNYLLAAQLPSEVLASSLIGMTIRNKAEAIGQISDLIMDKNYKLVGFVVDMSGPLGLIDKSVGISRDAVRHIDLGKGVIVVAVKKPQLQGISSYATQQELQPANPQEPPPMIRRY